MASKTAVPRCLPPDEDAHDRDIPRLEDLGLVHSAPHGARLAVRHEDHEGRCATCQRAAQERFVDRMLKARDHVAYAEPRGSNNAGVGRSNADAGNRTAGGDHNAGTGCE